MSDQHNEGLREGRTRIPWYLIGGTAVVICAVVAVLVLRSIATSQGPEDAPLGQTASTLAGPLEDGWTYVPAKYPLANSSVVRVIGTKDAEGCHYLISGTVHPGDPVRTTRRIAFNPTTCEADYETGDTPAEKIDADSPIVSSPLGTELPHG